MSIAQVVPLRRFPSDHQWFDYLIPDEMVLTPGHLVEVPFLRQQVPGVVWNIAETSTISRLKRITKLLRPEPIMTDWQRQVCLAIIEQSFVSLGHVLDSIIPNFPTRKTTAQPETPNYETQKIPSIQPPLTQTWWYRSRRDALSWIQWWMGQENTAPRLVMVPTLEDGQELFGLLHSQLPDMAFVHSKLNRTNYAAMYEGVRLSQIKYVIGTGRALTLPYPTAPEIVIDQEEHVAHKQTEQQPRTDYRRILETVKVKAVITTPAPSVRWWHQRHPQVPEAGQGLRQVVELGQVRKAPWLSGECETLIEKAQSEHQPLLMIAPQHGFASSISCRDCHLTVDCQQCHQRLRLIQQSNEIICRSCGQVQKLPASCPRCHGARWSTHGWGVDYIVGQLKQAWPGLTVSSEQKPKEGVDVVVDTYRGYRHARTMHNLGVIIIVNGDALLNYSDFSVAERAWQYLARLQAEAPEVPIIVQTFDPSGDFWQRWRRWDDTAWYEAELVARQRHALPPIADQWIARYPEKDAANKLTDKVFEIETMKLKNITVVVLPGARQQVADRILLTSTKSLISEHIDGLQIFPYPWQVDTTVASWLA